MEYEDGYDVTRTDEFVSLHPCAQLGVKQVGYYYDYYHPKNNCKYLLEY